MNPLRLILSKNLIIPALAALAANVGSYAYDIECIGADGQQYYFNIISETSVELTYCDTIAHGHYHGDAVIPSTVKGDKTYDVVAIGDGAFSCCDKLTGITFPMSVTRIGYGAFGWCTSLSSLTIPAQVTEIMPYAFQGCTALTAFDVETGSSNFSASDGLLLSRDGSQLIVYPPGRQGDLVLPSTINTLADGCMFDCYLLSSLHIPLSITSIGRNAVYNCGAISSVNIPADLTNIAPGAFGECASLSQFKVSSDNPVFSTDSMALYTSAGTLAHFAPLSSQYYKVADNTIEIGQEAFFRDYQLLGITMPEGLKTIADMAFSECWELNTLELPSTVDSIGSYTFALCDGLASLYTHIPDPSAVQMGELVFYGIDQDHCTLYVPEGTKAAYEAAAQWGDFANISEFASLADQEIVWTQSLSGLGAGSEIWLNAYATSNLGVSYTLTRGSSIASLIGSRLLLHKAGSIEIEARQDGNGRFRPAVPLSRTIDITDALPTIVAPDIDIRGERGFITITGAPDGELCHVFNIDGRLVYRGLARTILLRPDVYIVNIAATTAKVLVQ